MSIVLQMARTKQMIKRGRGDGKLATFPQGGRPVPGQLPPNQYQDQLQFQGVKHHEAEHQQSTSRAPAR